MLYIIIYATLLIKLSLSRNCPTIDTISLVRQLEPSTTDLLNKTIYASSITSPMLDFHFCRAAFLK